MQTFSLFALLVVLGSFGGTLSNPVPAADPEVEALRRNLTSLWNVVKQLQIKKEECIRPQVHIHMSGRGRSEATHAISVGDHLDAARASPGGGRRVYVHKHGDHYHLHESTSGSSAPASHSHTQHSHRHGDHYHFHDDMGNSEHHGTRGNVQQQGGDGDDTLISDLDAATDD